MHVGIDVKYIHTNFGGRNIFGFGDIATFKNCQISLSDDRNWLKKFMHVGIDVKYIHTNFGGRNIFGFGDIATFKNDQISLSDHGLYIVHGCQNI